ncbi:hypothetical protein BO85DRAFT_446397 [Aspergillus piperis CBS 112811]|uniref:Uncharacterized protein n=1 Tax=Aspergillus piperis CBS 112811 TaxID=1448313 RepID=A0A8G1R8G7_9EURO|nr:hypothetical protein BO85DRAFT_446397 [Aspergillus piperis CBS 112811]RAH61233.1 hypothetical protein BO85DRAFT_446397 [Aspergillus piperis CBS 112811]
MQRAGTSPLGHRAYFRFLDSSSRILVRRLVPVFVSLFFALVEPTILDASYAGAPHCHVEMKSRRQTALLERRPLIIFTLNVQGPYLHLFSAGR